MVRLAEKTKLVINPVSVVTTQYKPLYLADIWYQLI